MRCATCASAPDGPARAGTRLEEEPVERQSTQHSQRLDEELADEVEPLLRSGAEARVHESRFHEPPADDEPLPDARIGGEDTPMPGALDLDDIEARSLLAASLRPSAFPADRDELLVVADEEHAPPDVVEALSTLPAGRRFVNVQQVWEALGGERERRGATTDVPDEVEVEIEVELEPVFEPEPEPEPEPEHHDPLWLAAAR